MARIFISHSSEDKPFAELVVQELRSAGLEPWIDNEQIFTGDDIFDQLERGLQTMDIFMFLASSSSIESVWANLELKSALLREMREKRSMVLPFIIDDTPRDLLPLFLQPRHVSIVVPNTEGAKEIVSSVKNSMRIRSVETPERKDREAEFERDAHIEALIKGVQISDWKAASDAALKILIVMDESGENELFKNLIRYLDCSDEDLKWSAITTLETLAPLVPSLFDRKLLYRLAQHEDFSVRSLVASICMDFAQYMPEHVPVDILIELSRHDEDWYVMAPATAALQALAESRPVVLRIFFNRLHSDDPNEREFAASALADIAREEPELLDQEEFSHEISRLQEIGDKNALEILTEAYPNVQKAERRNGYKYGL